jgi:hypothetical protein
MKPDPVKTEWKRLMNLVRSDGFELTAEHIIEQIKTGSYPLYYSKKFVVLALKCRKFSSAEKILKALDGAGISHALIDELKAALLWDTGKHQEAIICSIESANRWLAPFIYYQASRFLSMKGRQKESDHYFNSAKLLAKEENEIGNQKS